jgi:hypothetical protein
MANLSKIVVDGAILSIVASLFLMVVLRFNPRLFLQDYPEAIQDQVPPKTALEERQSLLIGIPFLLLLAIIPFISALTLKRSGLEAPSFLQLFLHAFGVVFIFNLVDLLVLDWLMFCTITPKFIVIPGTEGMRAYKDYLFHFKASLLGTGISILSGLVIAGIVALL